MTTTHMAAGAGLPLHGPALLNALAANWSVLLLRGVAAIAFGILAFFWPGLTLLTLTLLWGAYALTDGAFALWATIIGKGETAPRLWLALAGMVSILAGLTAFFWPVMTTLALLMFIASWATVIGVLQIWGALQLRKELEGEWLLGLNGLLSIAFGALMFAWPGAGALALVWMIGWFAILAGCLYIALAFRLKRYKKPA